MVKRILLFLIPISVYGERITSGYCSGNHCNISSLLESEHSLNSVSISTYQLNSSGNVQHCDEDDPACTWYGDVVAYNKHVSQTSSGTIRVVPLVFNNAGTMITSFRTMISSGNYRSVIDTLTQEAFDNLYDGLSLDLEPSCWQSDASLCPGWPSSQDAGNYVRFVDELARSMHNIGKTLSIAVGAYPGNQCGGGWAEYEEYCANEVDYLSKCASGLYNISTCNCCAFTTWFDLELICQTDVDVVVNMDTYMDDFDAELFDVVMKYYLDKGCDYTQGRVAVGLLVQEGAGTDDGDDINALFTTIESYDGVKELDIWSNIWESGENLALWSPHLSQYLSDESNIGTVVHKIEDSADNAKTALQSKDKVKEEKQPNLVLMVFDDLGWADVGYHQSNIPTPFIDQFASEGIKLERMYSAPECTPSRSSLMTGRYSFRVGLQYFTTLRPGSAQGLPPRHSTLPLTSTTLAEVLKDEGYATHLLGKWHLGAASEKDHFPTQRGFNSFIGYLGGMETYYNHTLSTCIMPGTGKGGCFYPVNSKLPFIDNKADGFMGESGAAFDFWDDDKVSFDSYGVYSEVLLNERFIRIINDKRTKAGSAEDKPLFVYYSHQLAHIPLEYPPDPIHVETCERLIRPTQVDPNFEDYSSRLNTSKQRPVVETRIMLCATVSALDSYVGNVLKTLQSDPELWDNSLVWAVSDNGGMVSFGVGDPLGSSASSNWPLRGGKTTLFEGGIRSVSFVTGGLLPESAKGSQLGAPYLLHMVDVFPTFVHLATNVSFKKSLNLIESENQASDVSSIDGVNVWEYLRSGGKYVPHDLLMRKEIPVHVDVNPLLSDGVRLPRYLNDDMARLSGANYSVLLSWPWKLILGTPINPGIIASEACLMDGHWTISPYVRLPPPLTNYLGNFLLYNIEKDEEEIFDVSKDYPDIVYKMKFRLEQYWSNPTEGFIPPEINMPMPDANPMLWNWTWAPFKT